MRALHVHEFLFMFLAILIALFQVSLAIQFTPEKLEVNVTQGSYIDTYFIIKNDNNTTYSYSIKFSENPNNIASIIDLTDVSFSLSKNQSKQIDIRITIPEDMQPGVYTVKLEIKEYNASVTRTFYYDIKVNIQELFNQQEYTILKNQTCQINPDNVKLEIKELDPDNSKATLIIGSSEQTLQEGQCYEEPNKEYKICIDNVGSTTLRIKFYYKGTRSISCQYKEVEESQTKKLPKLSLTFIPSSIKLTVYGWQVSRRTVKLVNDGETKIKLISLDVDGTIIMSDGEKPIRVENYQLSTLEPGYSMSIPLVIDTYGLEPGTYYVTIRVYGKDEYNRNIVAELSITVKVTSKAIPSIEVNLDYPEKVNYNQIFTITISKIPDYITDVKVHVEGGTILSKSFTGKEYTVKIKATDKQRVKIKYALLKGEITVYEDYIEIPVEYKVELKLSGPTVVYKGKEVCYTFSPKDATVKFNDQELEPTEEGKVCFKPEKSGKLCIYYGDKSKCIQITVKEIYLILSLSKYLIYEGEKVKLTLKYSNNTPVTSGYTCDIYKGSQLYRTLTEPKEIEFDEAGTYSIECRVGEIKSKRISLIVKKNQTTSSISQVYTPPLVVESINETITEGETACIKLNKVASITLYSETGEVIDSRDTDYVCWKFNKAGNYTVYISDQNTQITKYIYVKPKSFFSFPINISLENFTRDYIVGIILGILLIAILVYRAKGGNPKEAISKLIKKEQPNLPKEATSKEVPLKMTLHVEKKPKEVEEGLKKIEEALKKDMEEVEKEEKKEKKEGEEEEQ